MGAEQASQKESAGVGEVMYTHTEDQGNTKSAWHFPSDPTHQSTLESPNGHFLKPARDW